MNLFTLLLLLSLAIVAECQSMLPRSGECCQSSGPPVQDCAAVENLGPGADLDGRCNALAGCSWNYVAADCCEKAQNDGFPNDAPCPCCCETFTREGEVADEKFSACCEQGVNERECNSIFFLAGFCRWLPDCPAVETPAPSPSPTCQPGTSGDCCKWKGPTPFDCGFIETLGPGADLDGRCNAVEQGTACEWDYTDPECCEIAHDDGFTSTLPSPDPCPDLCCDQQEEPGQFGNPFCFEGHACCPTTGQWVCGRGDGSFSCEGGLPCPVPCPDDVFTCWDGSTVSRDPLNNCEFYPCPARCAQDLDQLITCDELAHARLCQSTLSNGVTRVKDACPLACGCCSQGDDMVCNNDAAVARLGMGIGSTFLDSCEILLSFVPCRHEVFSNFLSKNCPCSCA